jgi:sugar lactone lactonase YvrE
VNKCGKFEKGATCQCDSACKKYGDCCPDIDKLCGKCKTNAECNDGNPCTINTCDPAKGCVNKAVTGTQVSTLAGDGTKGYLDGVGTKAKFQYPTGIGIDNNGTIYIADNYSHRIRKVALDGMVSTVAGSGVAGFANGKGTKAQFKHPNGLAVDSKGVVYIADYWNHQVRKVTADGTVSTFAGYCTSPPKCAEGNQNGPALKAMFRRVRGIAVALDGTVYLADGHNHQVRKINNGLVTLFAGSPLGWPNGKGYAEGKGSKAKFLHPTGLAVDKNGVVYVTTANHRLRKIQPDGTTSTLAGGIKGYADGKGTAAKFYNPIGVVLDGKGNAYIADSGNHRIRKVTPAGVVSTLVGGVAGYADGDPSKAKLTSPMYLAIDSVGVLYVTTNGHRIRKITVCGTALTSK